MQALPVGVPKLMVSTMAAGDTRDYVGAQRRHDDGLGHRRRRAELDLGADPRQRGGRDGGHGAGAARSSSARRKPLIGATMFGVTTPCVTHARERARGARLRGAHVPRHRHRRAGRWRRWWTSGFLAGRARHHDHRAVRRARRRRALGRAGPARGGGRAPGLPQVVSLGALDMVNFGARDTVPPQFEDRNLYVHNPSVTLMRTTPEECAELGRRIARKLSAATGPTALFIPLARRVDDRRRGPAVPRPRGRRGAVRGAARRARRQRRADRDGQQRQRPGVRRRDGRQARRVHEVDDRRRGPREAARDARRAAA